MNTQSTEVLPCWLTAWQIPQVGVKTLQKLMATHHIGIEELLTPDPAHLARLKFNPPQIKAIMQPDRQQIDRLLAWAEPANRHICCYFDQHEGQHYPQTLKNIACPPLLLFVKGDPRLLGQPQLAMVGSRNLSISGQDNAWLFAKQLSELGIIITSGLAIGVDGYCHRGALAGNGKTIAVLGSGLEQVYPKRHRSLADQIIGNGALVSEFLPHQGPKAANFPRRNRIIAGLSQGTLVVEAAIRSGSLITAKYAMEQGREVFAIPGSIHNPMSKGCHALIKHGAKLVEDIHDIIEEVILFQQLTAVTPGCSKVFDGSTQAGQEGQEAAAEAPVLQYIGYEVTPVDRIAQRSALPVNEVLYQLLSLEMQGDVASMDGGYIRIAKPQR